MEQRHEYADVNGVRLHYVTQGEGELMLFVHGFPEFWYEWRKQLPEFARDHRAVAFDMRGYNLSSKPKDLEAYRIPHLVEDVRQLALHLGHERFVLVAHDWGGAVAWAFAMRHPEMVHKLVAINAPHPGTFQREVTKNADQQQASQYMLFFRSDQAESVLSANNYAGLVEGILGQGLREGYVTEQDKQAYLEAWSRPGALTGGLNYYRAAALGPPTPDGRDSDFVALAPRRVAVPTLVIWGMKDTALLPGNLEGLDEVVDDLVVRRIDDGTHWVVHQFPDLVNGYIREFIES